MRQRSSGASEAPRDRLSFDDLTIDLGAWEVRLRGQPIPLTRTEFNLLLALASHPRRAVTYDEIVLALWDGRWFGGDGTIAVHISKLRTKLGESGIAPRHIRTVRGVGYRFEPSPDQSQGRWTGSGETPGHPSVTLLFSADRTIRWVSHLVRDLLGWYPGDLIGCSPTQLVHPDDRASIMRHKPSLDAGKPIAFNARLRTPAGDYREITHTLRPLHSRDGAFAGHIGQWHPIEARHHPPAPPVTVDQEPLTIFYDENSIAIDMEPRIALFDWQPEEIIGRYFSPSDYDEATARAGHAELIASGVADVSGISSVRCQNGTLVPAFMHMSLDVDDEGLLAGYRILIQPASF